MAWRVCAAYSAAARQAGVRGQQSASKVADVMLARAPPRAIPSSSKSISTDGVRDIRSQGGSARAMGRLQEKNTVHRLGCDHSEAKSCGAQGTSALSNSRARHETGRVTALSVQSFSHASRWAWSSSDS